MPSQTFTYKIDTSAGDIPATVHYAPASTPSTPRPVALIFHAGGWTVGSTAMIPAIQIAALLTLGFIVVTPEFRLCPQVSLHAGPIADAHSCLSWAQTVLPTILPLASGGVLADGTRVVAMGHSAGATLALHLGSAPKPPRAILDLYGPKEFSNAFWHAPLQVLAGIPQLPVEWLSQVRKGPQQLTSGPMFVNGKPDLSTPRNAWMLSTLRDGTNLAKVVSDGDFVRVDPVRAFKEGWPPTCFVHGTADVFAPLEVSVKAAEGLRALGVEAELVRVEGAAHIFDIFLKEEDALFQDVVMRGMKFLASHV